MTILKDKITLPCGAQIKNRICKAAMTERIAFADNYTNQRHLNLYKKWAEGDLSLIHI